MQKFFVTEQKKISLDAKKNFAQNLFEIALARDWDRFQPFLQKVRVSSLYTLKIK